MQALVCLALLLGSACADAAPSPSRHSRRAGPADASTALPAVDFGALGTVYAAGSFAGLQTYSAGAASAGSSTADSLWLRATNGSLVQLGATSDGGSIGAVTVCQSVVYIGGSFSALGGVPAANVASFRPASASFAALGSGVAGPVSALACDPSGSIIAGGSFAGGVQTWSGSSWAAPAFGGVNGAVLAIDPVASSSGASTLYGGNFTVALANGTAPSTSTVTNATSIASLGSALVPISLAPAEVWSGPNSEQSQFADAHPIFCPSGADGTAGSTWLARDGQAAIIVVRLYRPLRVGGLRIGNTHFQGRGLRQFKCAGPVASLR